MSDYDFHTLSPIDFENLIRDLLQCELSIRLESFKTGKDSGIDFRYSKAEANPLIVQAKHFADTGFPGLLSHMRLKERPKIEKLNPGRYLLATSVPLSPQNKNELLEVLFPYVKGAQDVYGRQDINNLLGLFPEVERQHFKLWLSSTAVMEEVLHSRILNQTRITLQDIKDKARIYVTNQSFTKALEILKEHQYVIIAGIPGIGKTILAKMLVLHYLRSDHDFIDVSQDISEAYSIPDHHRPRVYLYDDFLGRTSLVEKLRKNEDHRLFNFISAVRKTKSAKLILTTREYILHQAQTTYEILNSPIFDKPQCIIDLSQYTRPIRAQILYNHLYFSALPREYIEEIVNQMAYVHIIDHKNYNPRIVEYMTDPLWVGREQPATYPATFLQNLHEPFLIWEQAFNNHLSSIAREIVLVIATMPREVFVDDLASATKAFLSSQGVVIQEKEFHRALSELQGNFIVVSRDRGNDIVSFHNPSVQDFVEKYLEKNLDQLQTLTKGACFFEQVEWICNRAVATGYVSQIQNLLSVLFKDVLLANPCILINYSNDSGRSTYKKHERLRLEAQLAFIASLLSNGKFAFLKDTFRDFLMYFMDNIKQFSVSNDYLLQLATYLDSLDYILDVKYDFFHIAKESMFDNADWISDILFIVDFLELVPHMSNPEDDQRIIELIENIVDSLDCDLDSQTLSDELSTLEEIEKKRGYQLDGQIRSLHDLLSRAEENYSGQDENSYGRYSTHASISDHSLHDMFSTLIR
jgi:hypothetical protein